jgi:hypothetical protein
MGTATERRLSDSDTGPEGLTRAAVRSDSALSVTAGGPPHVMKNLSPR